MSPGHCTTSVFRRCTSIRTSPQKGGGCTGHDSAIRGGALLLQVPHSHGHERRAASRRCDAPACLPGYHSQDQVSLPVLKRPHLKAMASERPAGSPRRPPARDISHPLRENPMPRRSTFGCCSIDEVIDEEPPSSALTHQASPATIAPSCDDVSPPWIA